MTAKPLKPKTEKVSLKIPYTSDRYIIKTTDKKEEAKNLHFSNKKKC